MMFAIAMSKAMGKGSWRNGSGKGGGKAAKAATAAKEAAKVAAQAKEAQEAKVAKAAGPIGDPFAQDAMRRIKLQTIARFSERCA